MEIKKIVLKKWDNTKVSDLEKGNILPRIPKWITPFIQEINEKEITLVIMIQKNNEFHYHFEPLDADLSFRMQIASEV